MTQIRQADIRDSEGIRDLYLASFPEEERELVAALAVDLLSEQTSPATFAFAAEREGRLVGHIAFSPVTLETPNKFTGFLLAPLAVHPEFQKQGIGTTLIEAGFEHLSSLDVDIVFVYGDPDYYSRFGFNAESAAKYTLPYALQFPFGWLAKPLKEINTIASAGRLTFVRCLNNPQLW